MPDLYCELCKKVTPHKSLMRRSKKEEMISFTQRFARFIGKISTGKNYHPMEQLHFCRYCNCQTTVIEEQMVVSGEKPLVVDTKPEQVGIH